MNTSNNSDQSVEETTIPTIASLSNNSKNKRSLDNDESINSSKLTPQRNKQNKLEKIDPIRVLAGNEPFDLSDRISFESEIISETNAEIKFIMLDKNKNLLIFPCSNEDANQIMVCDGLLNSRKKINLSGKKTT